MDDFLYKISKKKKNQTTRHWKKKKNLVGELPEEPTLPVTHLSQALSTNAESIDGFSGNC